MKLHGGDKTAIRKSIAHWRRMRRDARGTEDMPGPHDCALCARYFNGGCEDASGQRCPVRQRSGRRNCTRTPYTQASGAWRNYVIDKDDSARDRWHRAADAEIGFLEGLLD